MYDSKVIEEIRDKLLAAKQTLSVAESVTSGHLQAAISSATQASEFFQGGMTLYNLGQKTRHLNVEPLHAQCVNCVSDNVATQMALEINKKFLSDYGISITGYASKVPEMGINELYAWFCITFKNNILVIKKISTEKENSVEAQIDYTNQVLAAFAEAINKR